MDDKQIVELFWERNESAISEAQAKYTKYCTSISYSILKSNEDSEECVNDTFMRAWQSIPPAKPESLTGYLGKLTRNIALDKLRAEQTKKRGGDYALIFEELENVLSDDTSPHDALEEKLLASKISEFLRGVSYKKRMMFIGRYWNMLSVTELAQEYGISEASVKTVMYRTREELKRFLKKEGFEI